MFTLLAPGCLKSTQTSLPTRKWAGSLMGIITGPRSGQAQVGVGVKSRVDFSGPVGRMGSLKEIAVLCINAGVGRGQES